MPEAMQTSPERTLFIAEVEAWGGAERSFLALCEWLHVHSLPYRLVTYWDRVGLEKFAAFPLIKTELSPENNPRSKISSLRKYFAHRPRNSPQPLMSGYQPALHATLAGLRGFHCFMHDTESFFDDWDLKKSWKTRLRRAANRQALHWGLASGGKTIVSSDFLKSDTERLYGVAATIARIGSESHGVEFRPRKVGAELRMLSVARVEINKRIDWIVQALAHLENRRHPLSKEIPWRLEVVGGGSQLEKLRTLSHTLGLGERVDFTGFVSDERLAGLYDEADLFLMPARQGYGIPALEALRRGIPVLLHRESGVSDLLLNTPWAQVFEGGPENLGPALERIVRSVIAGNHLHVAPPNLPTQEDWAEQVARLCGWV